MSASENSWLDHGRGVSPERTWSFTADAPLVGLDLARETGEAIVADAAGSVYLLDRRGRVITMARGLESLQEVAWSDAGETGAVVRENSNLTVMNRKMRVVWSLDFPQTISAIAVSPYGEHIAVCLGGGETPILNSNRKTVGRFNTTRPLRHARFVATNTELIGAAENGLVCSYHLDGSPIWAEPWWSNVGDMSITGDGQEVFLAGLNLGIQRFDGSGNSQGTYIIEGTPNRVSSSFALKRLITSTVERRLIWLAADGEIIWTVQCPEDVGSLRCDPLGSGAVCGLASGTVIRLDWGMPLANE